MKVKPTFETHEELEKAIINDTLEVDGDLVVDFDIYVKVDISVRGDIVAKNIKAWNIVVTGNISARSVSYYAFCIAYRSIVCKSIKGWRDNCKHISLSGEVIINDEESEIALSKTNLDEYETEPIDYAGCDPVVAKALKNNLKIECLLNSGTDALYKDYVVRYESQSDAKYVSESTGWWKNAKPIKKKKAELRVKGPVEVMQWLVDSGYRLSNSSGRYWRKIGSRDIDNKIFLFCGKIFCSDWDIPELSELLEEEKV